MQLIHRLTLLTLVIIWGTISCSHKSVTADAAITPSDTNASSNSTTAVSEGSVDQKAIARIVEGGDKGKRVASKTRHFKKAEAPKEALKQTVAPMIPVAPVVEAPKTAEVPKPQLIEANPEVDGFLANHFSSAIALAMIGAGYFTFFLFGSGVKKNS